MIRRDTRQGGGAVSAAAKALVVFTLATLVVAWLSWSEVPGRSGLIPLVWGFSTWLAMRRENEWPTHLGLTRARLTPGLAYYALSTVILLPLAVGGFELYLRTGVPVPVPVPAPEALAGVTLGEWSLYQFAVVAPFEELFFRGYIQGRLDQACRSANRSAAFTLWVPIVGSAACFGVAHVAVDRSLAGAGVVIPGLLFAWLRAKSGSLVAPTLSHGTANVVTRLILMHAGAR